MKKLFSIALCICLTLAAVFTAVPSFNKANADEQKVVDLLTEYSADDYVKHTEIYAKTFAVAYDAANFHAGAQELVRETLYDVEEGVVTKLYMSNVEGVNINSGYRDGDNGLEHFKYVGGVEGEADYTVTGKTVESFFVMLDELYTGDEWSAYTSAAGNTGYQMTFDTTKENVADNIETWEHFVAPMWDPDTQIVTFTKVAVYEAEGLGELYLELYASESLFAQAIVRKAAATQSTSGTLSFADTTTRTEYTTSKQVWEANGVTLTNNKAGSTTDVGNYSNPARFYKSSTITISGAADIASIVFDCSGIESKYVTPLETDLATIGTVTTDEKVITVTPNETSDTYTFTVAAGQARANSITVNYVAGGCNHFWANETTPATCTEDGTINQTCALCGDTAQKTIIAEHDWSAWEVTQEPTCTELGVKEKTCSVCGETEQGSVNKAEHVWDEGVVTKPAECEVTGVKTYTCQGCGKTEEEVIPATDHNFVDGVCANGCGATQETVKTKQWEKVTSAPADWSGTYLIVYEAGGVAFNGALSTLDAVSNTINVTITNGVIADSGTISAASFTIDENGYIKSASGYYIGQTSNANGLKSNKSTTYANTLSINADGSVNIVSGGAYLRFNKAADQNRFRYYKSGTYTSQQAICLYKLVEA